MRSKGEANRKRKLDTPDFEARLRERYRALWEDVQREVEKHQNEQYSDIVARVADPEDHAVADLLVDLDLAEISRDIDEMRAIQHAIDRIKRGTYGICAGCGEPIDPQRLQAIPHAALCLSCKARNERQRGDHPSL